MSKFATNQLRGCIQGTGKPNQNTAANIPRSTVYYDDTPLLGGFWFCGLDQNGVPTWLPWKSPSEDTPVGHVTVYLNPAGNDTSDGLTPSTAVRTLLRAAEISGYDAGGDGVDADWICAPGAYDEQADTFILHGDRFLRILSGTLVGTTLTNSWSPMPGAPVGNVTLAPDPTGLLLDGFTGSLTADQLKGGFAYVSTSDYLGGLLRQIRGNTAGTSAGGARIELLAEYPGGLGIPAGVPYSIVLPGATFTMDVVAALFGSNLAFVGSQSGLDNSAPNVWTNGTSQPRGGAILYGIGLATPRPPQGRALTVTQGSNLYLNGVVGFDQDCFVGALNGAQIVGGMGADHLTGVPLLWDLGIGIGQVECGFNWACASGSDPDDNSIFAAGPGSQISGFAMIANADLVTALDGGTVALVNGQFDNVAGVRANGSGSTVFVINELGNQTRYHRTVPGVQAAFACVNGGRIQLTQVAVLSDGLAFNNPFPAYLCGAGHMVEGDIGPYGLSLITSDGNEIGMQINGGGRVDCSPRLLSANFTNFTTELVYGSVGPAEVTTKTFTADVQADKYEATATGEVIAVTQT